MTARKPPHFQKKSPAKTPKSDRPNIKWAPELVQSVHSFQRPPPSMKSSLWWRQVPAMQRRADVEFVALHRSTFLHKDANARSPHEGISVFYAAASEALVKCMEAKGAVVGIRLRRETIPDSDDDSDFSDMDLGEEDTWYYVAYVTPQKALINVKLHLPPGSYEIGLDFFANGESITFPPSPGLDAGVYLSLVHEATTVKNI